MKNILTAVFIAAMILVGLISGALLTKAISGENPIQMVMRWREGEPVNAAGVHDGLEPDDSVQPAGNEEDEPADSGTVAEPEPPELGTGTELFEEVYVPYALREKAALFDMVKTFAENSGYTYEIEEPDNNMVASVKFIDGEDYVYIAFAPGAGDIETMMSVSYYQRSSNSEVSMTNYSTEKSPIYDKFQIRVTGEPSRDVAGTGEQREFLFAQ